MAKASPFASSNVSPKEELLPIFYEPQHLVSVDDDGRLKLNKATTGMLDKIHKPISVIGIVGKYRTGKSYLMNQITGNRGGFSVGNTVQGHTKGVWVRLCKNKVRDDEYIVLLDTEGMDDMDGNDERSIHIFILMVIVCSCVLVNCRNVIDENNLQLLQYPFQLWT